MSRVKNVLLAGAIASSGLIGGAIGATVVSAGTVALTTSNVAATTSATTAPAAAATAPFKSNEDTTHEAGESAAREAAENAGTAGIPQQ